jgi:hypothetical protein
VPPAYSPDMRAIGKLKLRDGSEIKCKDQWVEDGKPLKVPSGALKALADIWLDEVGEPLKIPDQQLMDELPVIVAAIKYIPEIREEVYDGEELEETNATPAQYQVFGFIPFIDINGNWIGGMPFTDVHIIWATEVARYYETWDLKSILFVINDIKNEDEDDEDEPEDDAPVAAPPAQPVAASP